MERFEHKEENLDGILFMAMHDLFSCINKMKGKFFIRCSYIEIYTDLIFDLLADQESMSETLTVNEDGKKKFFIKGVTEEII